MVARMSSSPGKISLTSDLWKDSQSRNFAVATAHYIDDDWVLQSVILDFKLLAGAQTAIQVAGFLWNTIQTYRIEQKILAVTTDNGSPMVKATQKILADRLSAAGNTKFMGIRCNAHIINIICQEVLSQPMGRSKRFARRLGKS